MLFFDQQPAKNIEHAFLQFLDGKISEISLDTPLYKVWDLLIAFSRRDTAATKLGKEFKQKHAVPSRQNIQLSERYNLAPIHFLKNEEDSFLFELLNMLGKTSKSVYVPNIERVSNEIRQKLVERAEIFNNSALKINKKKLFSLVLSLNIRDILHIFACNLLLEKENVFEDLLSALNHGTCFTSSILLNALFWIITLNHHFFHPLFCSEFLCFSQFAENDMGSEERAPLCQAIMIQKWISHPNFRIHRSVINQWVEEGLTHILCGLVRPNDNYKRVFLSLFCCFFALCERTHRNTNLNSKVYRLWNGVGRFLERVALKDREIRQAFSFAILVYYKTMAEILDKPEVRGCLDFERTIETILNESHKDMFTLEKHFLLIDPVHYGYFHGSWNKTELSNISRIIEKYQVDDYLLKIKVRDFLHTNALAEAEDLFGTIRKEIKKAERLLFQLNFYETNQQKFFLLMRQIDTALASDDGRLREFVSQELKRFFSTFRISALFSSANRTRKLLNNEHKKFVEKFNCLVVFAPKLKEELTELLSDTLFSLLKNNLLHEHWYALEKIIEVKNALPFDEQGFEQRISKFIPFEMIVALEVIHQDKFFSEFGLNEVKGFIQHVNNLENIYPTSIEKLKNNRDWLALWKKVLAQSAFHNIRPMVSCLPYEAKNPKEIVCLVEKIFPDMLKTLRKIGVDYA